MNLSFRQKSQVKIINQHFKKIGDIISTSILTEYLNNLCRYPTMLSTADFQPQTDILSDIAGLFTEPCIK